DSNSAMSFSSRALSKFGSSVYGSSAAKTGSGRCGRASRSPRARPSDDSHLQLPGSTASQSSQVSHPSGDATDPPITSSPVWEVTGNSIGILVILQQPPIEPSTWVRFEHRRTLEHEQGLVRVAMPQRL